MPFDGSTVRKLREDRGLTREAFAVAIGRSFPSVVAYESGSQVPPTAVVERIATALEVPVGRLFEEGAARV